MNTNLKANLLTYNSHPSIMFSFNWLIIIWKWGRGNMFEIGCSRSRGWKNFGRRWTREWGVIKIEQFSWTSYVLHSLTADVGTFLIWLIEFEIIKNRSAWNLVICLKSSQKRVSRLTEIRISFFLSSLFCVLMLFFKYLSKTKSILSTLSEKE